MAAPIFRSSGSVSGIVTGQGRNDLDIGETVTLSDAEAANAGASYVWVFEDIPVGSSASLVNPTSATPTFVPDVTGSYRIKVTVNGVDSSVKVIAVPLANSGARIPSFRERTEYDAGGNNKGWHEAMTVALRQLDSVVGGSGYATIVQLPSTTLTQRATLAFTTAFSVTDDAGNTRTQVDLANGGVAHAKLADLAGLSVLGRSANTSGVMAAITAGTDHHLLRRSGTSLGFGLLVNANVDAAAAIAHTKLADLAGASVLGRAAATSGPMAAITGVTEGDVLTVQGDGTIAFSAPSVSLAYTQIENNGTPVTQRSVLNLSTEFTATDDAGNTETDLALTTAGVGFSKLADLAGLSVLGRSANSSGVMAAITGTDGQALRVAGTTLGFGTLAAAAFAGTPDNGDVLTITAGVPTWEAPTGGIDGSGAANRLAYWSDADTLTSSAGLTYASNVLTHTASAAAANVSLIVENSHNASTSSSAVIEAKVGGTSGGNPTFSWNVPGGTSWTATVDNADSDKWKLARAGTTYIKIEDTSAGTITFGSTIQLYGFTGIPVLSYSGISFYFNPTTLTIEGGASANLRYQMAPGAGTAGFHQWTSNSVVRFKIEGNGNICIGAAGSYGGGVKSVVFFENATTEPSSAPSGGALAWAFGGALKAMGASGIAVTLAS